jgi:hypothetical protein
MRTWGLTRVRQVNMFGINAKSSGVSGPAGNHKDNRRGSSLLASKKLTMLLKARVTNCRGCFVFLKSRRCDCKNAEIAGCSTANRVEARKNMLTMGTESHHLLHLKPRTINHRYAIIDTSVEYVTTCLPYSSCFGGCSVASVSTERRLGVLIIVSYRAHI